MAKKIRGERFVLVDTAGKPRALLAGVALIFSPRAEVSTTPHEEDA